MSLIKKALEIEEQNAETVKPFSFEEEGFLTDEGFREDENVGWFYKTTKDKYTIWVTATSTEFDWCVEIGDTGDCIHSNSYPHISGDFKTEYMKMINDIQAFINQLESKKIKLKSFRFLKKLFRRN
ncbi:hypothetical protein [Bacillus toyonensis]|uniref:hypothetical protein n=1 Tax=Bacillus toyonensis TaxID=155322 RepID=UPI002E222F74|nr:hypothetical protein [Bacillus toyonensis]